MFNYIYFGLLMRNNDFSSRSKVQKMYRDHKNNYSRETKWIFHVQGLHGCLFLVIYASSHFNICLFPNSDACTHPYMYATSCIQFYSNPIYFPHAHLASLPRFTIKEKFLYRSKVQVPKYISLFQKAYYSMVYVQLGLKAWYLMH